VALPTPPRRPNIVMVLVDDMRGDEMRIAAGAGIRALVAKRAYIADVVAMSPVATALMPLANAVALDAFAVMARGFFRTKALLATW
jgi:hypothetical protein